MDETVQQTGEQSKTQLQQTNKNWWWIGCSQRNLM